METSAKHFGLAVGP